MTLIAGYPEGIEDLHDETGRLMRAKVDVLLHAAGPNDALGLVLACRALGWRPGALLGYGPGYAYRETVAALPGGLDGVELARMAHKRWPHLRILLTSGFPQDRVDANGDLLGQLQLLSKPYSQEELATALWSALEG